MYYNGEGVPQDKEQAFFWLLKAAEQGDANSQYNVALMYGKGEGVKQDDASALEWMRKAAEQGYEPAVNELKKIEESK